MDIDINKPMHVCIYLNKRDFKTIEVFSTQAGPHTDVGQSVAELAILFPLSQIELAMSVGRALAKEFGLGFNDMVTDARGPLSRIRFKQDDTVFQQSAAASLRMLHRMLVVTGNDLGTGALADAMLSSDQQEAFERLGKWVADNAKGIWLSKANLKEHQDVMIDLAALVTVATRFDLSYLEGNDLQAVMQRRENIENLFATNALRRDANTKSVLAFLTLKRLDNLDGYPIIRNGSTSARDLNAYMRGK
jgi:hypothetical protein